LEKFFAEFGEKPPKYYMKKKADQQAAEPEPRTTAGR